MTVNLEELSKNEFWQRKMRTVMKIRDANKDGLVSRADYRLVIQRYKEMGASEEHLKKLEDYFSAAWKAGGVLDDTTEVTFQEFAVNFRKNAEDKFEPMKIFSTQFEIIDSNGDGEISLKEWVEYYRAMGIDTVHARASFDAMDMNADGVISKEEFAAYVMEFMYTTEDKMKSSLLYGPLVD